MSRGIGTFLDKQVKLKIYQQRANQYNAEFDQMEEQGHDPDKIASVISDKQFQSRHSKDAAEPLPFERYDKVLPVTGTTHLGFDKAHTILSANKQMMEPMAQRMQKLKDAKSKGETIEVDNVVKQQKINEREMKARIQYDHINDMHQMKHSDPAVKKSNYQQNYVHTHYMQEECDNQNFDFHQKKNDLKQYQEAYIICKKTLRK